MWYGLFILCALSVIECNGLRFPSQREMIRVLSSSATAAMIAGSISPQSCLADMLTFPLPSPLKNNYVFARSGECFADSHNEVQTNPVKKLRQDNALTFKGREEAIGIAKDLNRMNFSPSFIWTSNTERAYETAVIVARELELGQNRIIPEYSFLDARSTGIFEGKNMESTWKVSLSFFLSVSFFLFLSISLQHTHAHTYIHKYTHTYTHAYTNTHIHTQTHTHTYTHKHIHTNTHSHKHIHTHTHTHTSTYTHIHTHTHTYTYTYTHSLTHIHTHKYTHIHVHIHTHSLTHIYIHTHTLTHTHTRTHTHTLIHTHTDWFGSCYGHTEIFAGNSHCSIIYAHTYSHAFLTVP